MKKTSTILLITLVLAILAAGFFVFKNKNDSSNEQQVAQEALALYEQSKAEGMDFSSQCLGTIFVDDIGYAVDIVHVPRSAEDNLPENQCGDYRQGKVSHFIELDKDGNVVRVN